MFSQSIEYCSQKRKNYLKIIYTCLPKSKTLQNHFDNSAKIYIKKFKLKKNSNIIDIGSNDGIALKKFY